MGLLSDLPLFSPTPPPRPPAPAAKGKRFPGGAQGKLYRLLLDTSREEPLSLLDLDRTVYGTAADRLVRFFRRDADRNTYGWGVVLRSKWRENGRKKFKVYWVEKKEARE